METEKPKMDIPKPGVAKVFDLLTVALFAAGLAYLLLHWNRLPDQIPAHFGANGEVDRWGSKFELFILPAIALFLWIGLSVLEKYPHLYNYINLHPDNVEIQYRYGVIFMNVMKNLSTLLMAFIMWQLTDIALGRTESLNMPIFIGILAVLFISMGYYFYRMIKL
ncbi:hypothetical protein HMPREF9372_1627 [Sporosarcina newyorkensis 2681]|uniref:DUF1648 domain-containing protein n=1 Tax=Sporosarcina newyorkensis 2681 TaxID=1027292 RepID=F9DS47_9BACL|nr:DUF1648 domain-containing protein [Sporosarcina newyorkensis]EGQ26347.1 hypothetical protein HMPREF9372_1627 [Sporosarcina newyorkensis 2681]